MEVLCFDVNYGESIFNQTSSRAEEDLIANDASLMPNPRKITPKEDKKITPKQNKEKLKGQNKSKKEKPQFLSDIVIDESLTVKIDKLTKGKAAFTFKAQKTDTGKTKQDYEKSMKEFEAEQKKKEEKQKKLEEEYHNGLTNKGKNLEKENKGNH